MMTTDPIADLLTRIRNAQKANHFKVMVPYSKIKADMLNILVKYKFIEEYQVTKNKNNFQEIEVVFNNKRPPLSLERVSKPGQRIYFKRDQIKKIKSGLGISIISTSSGVMAGHEAFMKKLGGELLCEIY